MSVQSRSIAFSLIMTFVNWMFDSHCFITCFLKTASEYRKYHDKFNVLTLTNTLLSVFAGITSVTISHNVKYIDCWDMISRTDESAIIWPRFSRLTIVLLSVLIETVCEFVRSNSFIKVVFIVEFIIFTADICSFCICRMKILVISRIWEFCLARLVLSKRCCMLL